MATTERSTVVGVFHNRDQANRAVEDLKRAGFRDDQIGYIMRHDEKTGATVTKEGGTYSGEGAATGVVVGGVLGGLAGAVAAGLIPGVGPFLAAGILAATVGGAAAGAAAGGVLGGLVGLGIPEEEAKYYESEFHSGRILVTVRADSRYNEAWTIMQRHGAYNQATANLAGTSKAMHTESMRAGTGEKTIKVHEEELHPRKQSVETGEVRVRKEVHTEIKTLEVPVQHEEVVIERHPVGNRYAAATDIRSGEEIRIPVREEEVHIEKIPVVKEEVTVGKRKVTDTEKVSGTVRKEEVHIEREGEVKVKGDTKDVKGTNRGKKN